ncbi:2-isopropylmalate synthase, partial [bacterium]|nr:2-isopropylmalate synthase [bacterium]
KGRPLYQHPKLTPKRFGVQLGHALGKLGGVASILNNAEKLGLTLTKEEAKTVSKRVSQLGDEGKQITIGDLPYIIAEVLNRSEYIVFEVVEATSTSVIGRRAVAAAKIRFRKREYEISEHGDGGFNAFMNALHKWAKGRKTVVVPHLVDYDVNIPPGGSSAALVQVSITWQGSNGEGEFTTIGVHCDQVLAAIEAAASAMNACNQKNSKHKK